MAPRLNMAPRLITIAGVVLRVILSGMVATPANAQDPYGPGTAPGGVSAMRNQAVPMAPYEPSSPSRPSNWPGSTPPIARNALPTARQASLTMPLVAAGEQGGSRRSKFEGAEIVARVGPEVILANDVLFMVNRFLAQKELQEKIAGMSHEDLEHQRLLMMRKFLEPIIQTKLWLVAAKREVPAENLSKMEEAVNKSFDGEQIKKLAADYGVSSRSELETELRKIGSSVDAQKRMYFERSLASMWQHRQIKIDEEVTHEQMLTYYRAHLSDYETQPQARWEQITAAFSKQPSEAEAFRSLALWGNQILAGAKFADVAKKYSDDASSVDGGQRPWTNEGSLVSQVLDRALFTLPVGQLSQIIKDEQGFHIIRVQERHGLERKAFTDVQAEIKTKIRDERTREQQETYSKKLRSEIPVSTMFDKEESQQSAADLPAR